LGRKNAASYEEYALYGTVGGRKHVTHGIMGVERGNKIVVYQGKSGRGAEWVVDGGGGKKGGGVGGERRENLKVPGEKN